MQGEELMTTRAITRVSAQPLMRLAGVCALILFVVIILPR